MSTRWAKFLRGTRKNLGWTQGRLAEEARRYLPEGDSVSVAWISAMERNTSHPQSSADANPSEAVAVALARAMGVPADDARRLAGYATSAERLNPVDPAISIVVMIPPTGDVTLVNGSGTSLRAPREMFSDLATRAREFFAAPDPAGR